MRAIGAQCSILGKCEQITEAISSKLGTFVDIHGGFVHRIVCTDVLHRGIMRLKRIEGHTTSSCLFGEDYNIQFQCFLWRIRYKGAVSVEM